MVRKHLKDGVHWTCQYNPMVDSYIIKVEIVENSLSLFMAYQDVNNYYVGIKTVYSILEAIWFLSLMVNNFIEDRRIV